MIRCSNFNFYMLKDACIIFSRSIKKFYRKSSSLIKCVCDTSVVLSFIHWFYKITVCRHVPQMKRIKKEKKAKQLIN